jgi:ABC-type Fe3+ transport system permease subunit
VRRLVARRDQVVRPRRSLSGSIVLTWQTLLNSVTFGHNVAFAALRWGEPAAAERPWQRRIDILASVVLAIPALALALAIELAGAPFGRGAVYLLRLDLL